MAAHETLVDAAAGPVDRWFRTLLDARCSPDDAARVLHDAVDRVTARHTDPKDP